MGNIERDEQTFDNIKGTRWHLNPGAYLFVPEHDPDMGQGGSAMIMDDENLVHFAVFAPEAEPTMLIAGHDEIPNFVLTVYYADGKFTGADVDRIINAPYFGYTSVGMQIDSLYMVTPKYTIQSDEDHYTENSVFDYKADPRGGLQLWEGSVHRLTALESPTSIYMGQDPHKLADMNFHYVEDDVAALDRFIRHAYIEQDDVPELVSHMRQIRADLFSLPPGGKLHDRS